ncbi:MAG: histidine phosphatase family protein [Saprospiraceae bacterium]|nr:histidine phosphatase family protein [Saprospiraceae bacterium]
MKKNIFIVRHAKSSWEFSMSDMDRPLNERGLLTAPKMAKLFKNLILEPILLISSPANRALSTAKIFHSELNTLETILIQESLYYGDENSYLDCLETIDEIYQSVALFGHNPKVENFTSKAKNGLSLPIPTCSIVCFEAKVTRWKDLDWMNIEYINHYFPKEV